MPGNHELGLVSRFRQISKHEEASLALWNRLVKVSPCLSLYSTLHEVRSLMDLMLAFALGALHGAFRGEWSVEKGSRL